MSTQSSVSPVWREAIAQACEGLLSRSDLDANATLRLMGDGDDLLVELTLGDGRSAIRRVHAPSALALTLEALITVPPPAPAEPAPQVAPSLPPRPPPQAPLDEEKPPVLLTPEPERVPRVRPTILELGLAEETRFAGAPAYAFVGVSGYAAVPFHRWLLGLSVRWDAVQLVQKPQFKNFEFDEVGIGFWLAHRIVQHPKVLWDVGTGASVIVESQSIRLPESGEDSDSATDIKLFGMTRLQIGKNAVRFAATLDVELSPTRLRRPIHIDTDLPRLPSWGGALALGVAWQGR